MTTPPFQLVRNAFGRLVLTGDDGQRFDNVVPVRAFPIQAPDDGLSIVSADGAEVAWIARLSDLPEAMRQLLEEELAGREFMPEISRIHDVTSFAAPCTWQVDTDRGQTQFVLRGEEDIRRIGPHALLIADSHGIHFLIRDMQTLDRHSRRILDRFL